MPTLTREQIARARQEKKGYLLSLLLMICSNGFRMLVGGTHPGNQALQVISGVCAVGAIVFGMIMTWRLCRSIRIGIPMTVLATILAPFIFIFELIVLLRIYARRTGLGLTFMMGDKEPHESIAA